MNYVGLGDDDSFNSTLDHCNPAKFSSVLRDPFYISIMRLDLYDFSNRDVED